MILSQDVTPSILCVPGTVKDKDPRKCTAEKTSFGSWSTIFSTGPINNKVAQAVSVSLQKETGI